MRTRGKWFDYDTGTRTIRAIGHLPSGLSAALAVLQADGLAGSAFDREGAGAADFLTWSRAQASSAPALPVICGSE